MFCSHRKKDQMQLRGNRQLWLPCRKMSHTLLPVTNKAGDYKSVVDSHKNIIIYKAWQDRKVVLVASSIFSCETLRRVTVTFRLGSSDIGIRIRHDKKKDNSLALLSFIRNVNAIVIVPCWSNLMVHGCLIPCQNHATSGQLFWPAGHELYSPSYVHAAEDDGKEGRGEVNLVQEPVPIDLEEGRKCIGFWLILILLNVKQIF